MVHARGSAAHGYFEACEVLSEMTCAAPFVDAGKVTPVVVRFSTVAGERGSGGAAAPADARGWLKPGQPAWGHQAAFSGPVLSAGWDPRLATIGAC